MEFYSRKRKRFLEGFEAKKEKKNVGKAVQKCEVEIRQNCGCALAFDELPKSAYPNDSKRFQMPTHFFAKFNN